MMTPKEAGQYVNDQSRGVIRPGLSRTYELLRRLGNPQEKLSYVHVAGTNGKGSICAMTEAVLRAAGYRTGLYTSPHPERVNEEICVCGEEIGDAAFSDLMTRVSAQADRMADPPSRFEIMTAAALLYFYEMRCEIVIMETGMGGLTDATNVIPAPLVCVISNIGMDHTEYLGDTPEKIAEQKAGIIKSGAQVVGYDLPENIRRVINEAAACSGAAVRYADFGSLWIEKSAQDCTLQCFRYFEKPYRLSLSGTFQVRNAAVVLETVQALRLKGLAIPEEAVINGFLKVSWPSRFEILRTAPLLVLDGGHNPQCAAAFAESLEHLQGKRKWHLVLGMLRDKEYEAVIRILSPHAERFYCTAPQSSRALPAEDLARSVRAQGCEAAAYESIDEALDALPCGTQAGPSAVFGSLYLAGAVRRHFSGALQPEKKEGVTCH